MAKITKFRHKLKYYLALASQRQKQNDLWGELDALKNAKNLAKTKFDKQKLNLMIAQTYFEMNQHMLSMEHFFMAMENPTLRAASLFGVGRSLVELNKLSLALDYFELCLKFDYSNQFAHAVFEWTEFIKEKTLDITLAEEMLFLSAKNLVIKKEYEKAKNLLSTQRSSPKVLGLLAVSKFFLGDKTTAKNLANEGLLLNDDIMCFFCLFLFYKDQKNEQKAQSFLDKMFFKKDKTKAELLEVSIILSFEKQFQKAEMLMQELVQKEEFNPTFYLFLAILKFNQKKIDEAILNASKSMWIDAENPIYGYFLNLFKTGEKQSLPLSAHLPKDIANQKQKSLLEVFCGGKFEKSLEKSFCLFGDIFWCFLEGLEITPKASEAIFSVNSKKAQNLRKKLMICPSISAKQKFLLAKNAILSNSTFSIKFVSNFRVSSFYIKKSELTGFSLSLKEAVANAISFCECFFQTEMLLQKILRQAKILKNQKFLENFSAETITCLLLFDYPKVFEFALKFFDTKRQKILDIKNVLKGNI